ncbi:MAG: 30S ribosomal protein S18 [Oligoflexia bacterium]|nr:30S ribosomal protein S18 [Oligoflexia bacterium]
MDDDFDVKDGDKRYSGQHDVDKDRRMFSRKKSCWFCAKKTDPDWKDPSSYAWLVNEFGKISPGRITGLCAKHQRHATTAIKRGRNICLIGYISGRTSY